MDPFVVELYERIDGYSPVEEFLDSIEDPQMKAKAFRQIELLAQLGNKLREPHSKKIGNEIYELRIKSGSNNSRILYFFEVDRKIVLTNGFIKKRKKTPKPEIELALKYRSDYLARNK